MSAIINFSGGRTSAYMTKRLIDEGLEYYIVVFQNTGKEMPETLDFINECDKRWNLNIVWLEYRYGNNFEVVDYETASRNGEPFDQLLKQENALPNVRMKFCTKQLKINTLKRWAKSIGVKRWDHYVGIRYDEPHRWGKTDFLPKYMEVTHPLRKWKVTNQDVLKWWDEQEFNLKLHKIYGNCDGCFLKGKGILSNILSDNPNSLQWWEDKEKEYKRTFKKEISYKQLRERQEAQPGLFDGDPSLPCFCNID